MGLLRIVNILIIRNRLDAYAKCNFFLVVTHLDNSYGKHPYTQTMNHNRG
jgi:hypothetical protein